MEDHDSPACNQPTVRKGRSGPITDRIARWGSTLNWYIIGLLVPILCRQFDTHFLFNPVSKFFLASHLFSRPPTSILTIRSLLIWTCSSFLHFQYHVPLEIVNDTNFIVLSCSYPQFFR